MMVTPFLKFSGRDQNQVSSDSATGNRLETNERTDVFPGRIEPVAVVEVAERGEEAPSPALLVRNDNAPLPALLDIIRRNDGPHPPERLVHEFLVDVERVVRRLLEERLVRDPADVNSGLGELLSREGNVWSIDKIALGDKVRAELLCYGLGIAGVRRRDRRGTVRLEAPGGRRRRDVEVLVVDALLVLGAGLEGDARGRGEDVDGRVLRTMRGVRDARFGGKGRGFGRTSDSFSSLISR